MCGDKVKRVIANSINKPGYKEAWSGLLPRKRAGSTETEEMTAKRKLKHQAQAYVNSLYSRACGYAFPLADNAVYEVSELIARMPAPHFSLVVMAGSIYGKTTLVKQTVRELIALKRFRHVYLMSTTHMNPIWAFIPPSSRGAFDDKMLSDIIYTQQQAAEKAPPTLLLFDDVLSDKDARYSKQLESLFTMGAQHQRERHPDLAEPHDTADAHHEDQRGA